MAEEPSDLLVVDRCDLREMIRTCYELTKIMVHAMLDRSQHFTLTDLHDEKILALGKLAAGLAHELNNSASAIARSTARLLERLGAMDATSRALGDAGLSVTQLATVDQARDQCLATVVHACVRRSSKPIARTRSLRGSPIMGRT